MVQAHISSARPCLGVCGSRFLFSYYFVGVKGLGIFLVSLCFVSKLVSYNQLSVQLLLLIFVVMLSIFCVLSGIDTCIINTSFALGLDLDCHVDIVVVCKIEAFWN